MGIEHDRTSENINYIVLQQMYKLCQKNMFTYQDELTILYIRYYQHQRLDGPVTPDEYNGYLKHVCMSNINLYLFWSNILYN